MNIIKENGINPCQELLAYFGHLINLKCSDNSIIYKLNYDYEPLNYHRIKVFFIDSITSEIYKNKSFSLILLSDLIEDSQINKNKFYLKDICFSISINKFKIFKIDNKIIQIGVFCITNEDELKLVLDFLYSGYYSYSFITEGHLDLNFKGDFIIPLRNKHNNLIGINLDYSIMQKHFNSLYFNFGGFDFGQFILIRL